MTARLLALPAILAALFALSGCSNPGVTPTADDPVPAPEPRPRAGGLPAGRQPTPEELADAQKAYKALDGDYRKDDQPDGQPIHRFSPPYPLTADSLAKLPDLPFDYTLELIVSADTPPGTLKPLARLRNLRSVSVHPDPRREDGDITPRIAELVAVPNLEHLDLHASSRKLLTDELAGELAAFPSLRRLVGEGPISDAGLEKLARHPKLESLALQSCPDITDAGLAHLAKSPTLRTLVLQHCPKPTAGGLRHFTKEPQLVGLAIGGEAMKEDAMAEVEKIPTLEWLNLLSFDAKGLTERGLGHIARLPRLRQLTLPKSMTHTDAGLKALAAAPALENVNLSACAKVTDAGVKELARMTSVKSLRIHGAEQITDDALKALGSLPELVSLDLGGAKRVTDAGLRAFVEGRGDKLVSLSLVDLPVTDEFVTHLAKKAPDLRSLHFYECKGVTDKSVAPLSELTKLRSLSVRQTSISPEGVNTLKQRLPGCRVDGPIAPSK
jgi:hypothetical protein